VTAIRHPSAIIASSRLVRQSRSGLERVPDYIRPGPRALSRCSRRIRADQLVSGQVLPAGRVAILASLGRPPDFAAVGPLACGRVR